jgi:GGDEF domain-containing protein
MIGAKALPPRARRLVFALLCHARGSLRAPEENAIKRSASALIAPALLLPTAAVVSMTPGVRDSVAVHAAPLLVFGGGALLGLLTGRGRLLLGLMVLALTTAALINFGTRTTFYAAALLLPLNLGLIAWLGETRALSRRGASLLGLILLQAGIVGLLQVLHPTALDASLEQPLVPVGSNWTSLPQLAVFMFAVMLGAHLARFVRGRRPLHAAAVWALIASFLALDAAGSGGFSELHFATAGMLLALGTVLEPRPVTHRDAVTGLPASLEFNKLMRHLPRHYALACVAIDDFRAFRQEQGAAIADRMLRRVAHELDKVGGGGRAFYLMRDNLFAVVFRRKSTETAARQLEVVRRAVERVTLDVKVTQPTKSGQKTPVVVQRTVGGTISAGIAEPQRRDVDPFNVLRDAEEALRRAQVDGMNRIVVQPRAEAAPAPAPLAS